MKSALFIVALLLASCVATEETASTSLITIAPASTIAEEEERSDEVITLDEASSYDLDLAALVIAAECDSPDYDRSDWPHWSQADEYAGAEAFNVRHLILIRDSKVAADIRDQRVRSGWWISPYDGTASTNPRDFDIDHIVPLSEAHQSGGCEWSRDERKEYANDPAGLLAVSSASNRSKGGDDPAEWLPAEADFVCDYLTLWIGIKIRSQLTIDAAEHDAIASWSDECS